MTALVLLIIFGALTAAGLIVVGVKSSRGDFVVDVPVEPKDVS